MLTRARLGIRTRTCVSEQKLTKEAVKKERVLGQERAETYVDTPTNAEYP
jgi:hypothetical protein